MGRREYRNTRIRDITFAADGSRLHNIRLVFLSSRFLVFHRSVFLIYLIRNSLVDLNGLDVGVERDGRLLDFRPHVVGHVLRVVAHIVYFKARCRESEDFRYIKTSIYDTKNHDLIFFENGKELYVFDNLDLLEYNGKKYDVGTHLFETPDGTWCDVFVDDDKLGVGRYIPAFR